MKNSLTDLNDHLFCQLERLGDENASPDQIELEIERAKAIAGVADRVIHNAAIILKAREQANGGNVTLGNSKTDHLLALENESDA
ncbi:hypothetical protein [Pseudohongiella spirulinae]|uniref:Phage protein n=1 Tax=Pseudohongiella spirulinae TaxID=1249552 RepID=A0A0S2KE75_9GAMM|nr:hypothetical protein [Pseudohongiella spirulinae]ALO46608.1 hypothetical protein PS2015_1966 [Pseudohongiella spirulinae]